MLPALVLALDEYFDFLCLFVVVVVEFIMANEMLKVFSLM